MRAWQSAFAWQAYLYLSCCLFYFHRQVSVWITCIFMCGLLSSKSVRAEYCVQRGALSAPGRCCRLMWLVLSVPGSTILTWTQGLLRHVTPGWAHGSPLLTPGRVKPWWRELCGKWGFAEAVTVATSCCWHTNKGSLCSELSGHPESKTVLRVGSYMLHEGLCELWSLPSLPVLQQLQSASSWVQKVRAAVTRTALSSLVCDVTAVVQIGFDNAGEYLASSPALSDI